ncbi:hypothetical protein [Kribbella sp. C-35]|uniref:hypothetical protein n=1 Tax=Kribbella sp. C-35 TaxID=2789276 RepID=UPI00397C1CAD
MTTVKLAAPDSAGVKEPSRRVTVPAAQAARESEGRLVAAARRARKFRDLLGEVGTQETISYALTWRLTQRVRKHRSALTRAWSPDTIYPGSESRPRDNTPASFGQCGVSSAWLIRQLSWLRRRQAEYCVGYVLFGGGRGRSELHCWVEIGDATSTKRLVIDLTADQFEHLSSKQVLCAPHERLVDQLIEYKADYRMRFGMLREDDVWERYQALRKATGYRQRLSRRPQLR